MLHGRGYTIGGRDTKLAWERFRSGDQVDSGPAVRPEILSSWRRSDKGHSDPEHSLRPLFGSDVDTDSRLYRAAACVLDDLADKLSDTTTAVFLCDPDGTMIDRRWCDGAIDRRFRSIPTEPGFSFSEDVVGTTVAALFAVARKPCYVAGAEHFHPEIHDMSCFAAPVRDPVTCEYVAMIDITCLYREANKLVMPLVLSAADAISQRLAEDSSRRESLILQSFARVKRRSRRPLICVSDEMLITNAAAAQLLHQIDQAVLWENAFDATRDGGTARREIPLRGGARLMADCTAIVDGSEVVGSSIQLEKVQRSARGSSPTVELPGVAGSSLIWQATCRDVDVALSSGNPTLLQGEAGTGKAALASAALGQRCTTVQQIDCADPRTADDIEALLKPLRSGTAAILLRHIERLPASAGPQLAEALAVARDDRRLVVGTYVDDIEGEKSSSLKSLFGSVLPIPALRNRIDDLPMIMRSLLRQSFGSRQPRIGQDVIQVLLRYQWPGNVDQLRTVLSGLVATAKGPLVSVADLPQWLAGAATRRQLTAMEQAEADAVRRAMRSAHGNKTEAAAQLGISRSTFYRKLRLYRTDLESTIF